MISVTGVIVSVHSHDIKEKGPTRYFDLLSIPADGSDSRALLLSFKDQRPASQQNVNFFQGQNVTIDAQFSLFNGKIYWSASSISLDASSKFSLSPTVAAAPDESKSEKLQRVKSGVF